MIRLFCKKSAFALFLLLFSPHLKAAPLEPNVLIYNEGDTQVTSEIYIYQNLIEGVPIKGSVLITHDSTIPIDINSFRLGDKPLKVSFAQSASMSTTGTLEVSVYNFQLEGLKAGSNTLPPITVRVGARVYEAPPMTVDIAPAVH